MAILGWFGKSVGYLFKKVVHAIRWRIRWRKQADLEACMCQRLVDAWVAAERNCMTFKLKLCSRRDHHLSAELIVTCSQTAASHLEQLIAAKLKKEHYRNGGVARSRFVLCAADDGHLVAVFGIFGHFAEGAPFMQIASGDFPEMEGHEDWVVVSTEPVLTTVPDEVKEEAARIASVKAGELQVSPWSRDGNQRMFLLRDRTASSTSDPCELRVNLYRDNFEVSTQEICVDPAWSCAICLGGFSDSESVRRLACGHAFHSGCIKAWLRRGQRCPLGRCHVPKEVLAALRRLMDFSMPEAGAWPTLPQDVVKQEVPASSLERRAPGPLPHLRHSQGWRRFRAEDFNAEILVERLC